MGQINRITFGIMAAGIIFTGLTFVTTVSAAGNNACTEDIAKFCQNIQPGTRNLMDCLEMHEDELSIACKQHEATMDRTKEDRNEQVMEKIKFGQACLSDMAKFCNNADPARNGMINCLNDHEKEISAVCRESLKVILQ